VIGIYDFGFHIAGGRLPVKRHDNPWVILIGITFHVFARRAVHGYTIRGGYIDADFGWIVEPYAIFDDLSVEASFAEFLSYVIGGSFVFDGPGNVRSLGQCAEVLFGELGAGNGKEAGFNGVLGVGIAEIEYGWRRITSLG